MRRDVLTGFLQTIIFAAIVVGVLAAIMLLVNLLAAPGGGAGY